MKLSRLLHPAGMALITLLSHTTLYAGDESLGAGLPLPYLDIESGGEISVRNNDISVSPWNSKSFETTGKVHVVHYVAANRKVARQNKPFSEAIDERKFSTEKLGKTVIVHMADTLSIARALVVNTLADRKSTQHETNFVIDDKGLGLERWGVKRGSYAIIVLNAHGNLLFAKDGPLSEIEIETTIKLIEQQMI
jgi:YtfJ family uncharacterized protein